MQISIDGLMLHYEQQGEGKPVLLLHGWGANTDVMKPIATFLAGIGRKAISLDFPGFGKSEPPKEAWGVEQYGDLTLKFIETLGLKGCDVLAHSFGARVVILLASNDEHLFDKIVLTGAAGIRPKRTIKYYVKVYTYKLGKKLKKIALFDRLFHLSERQKNAGSADYRALSGIMRQTLVKVVNSDLSKRLPLIKNETLLIWGENDTETPLYMAKRMESEIPRAGLALIKNAGHFSFLDQYQRFCSILKVLLEVKE